MKLPIPLAAAPLGSQCAARLICHSGTTNLGGQAHLCYVHASAVQHRTRTLADVLDGRTPGKRRK